MPKCKKSKSDSNLPGFPCRTFRGTANYLRGGEGRENGRGLERGKGEGDQQNDNNKSCSPLIKRIVYQ